VGIVENTKYDDLREAFRPLGFFPQAQNENPDSGTTFVLRISGSPALVMHTAKSIVAQTSPAIGILGVPLSTQLADSLLRDRLMAMLSAGFGLLAVLLATLGLYGVIAYMVARRRKEIGVPTARASSASCSAKPRYCSSSVFPSALLSRSGPDSSRKLCSMA
jgi:hypothetical protein